MAQWLGKIEIQEENLSNFFKERKELMKYYLDEMKFRLKIKLDLNELNEFKQAVINKYGKFSDLNSKKALHNALKNWIHDVLSE